MPPMSQYYRNSSGFIRPHQSSPLTADGVGNPGVDTVNELLSVPAQGQPAEPKAQPIWITSESPPRPPRRSRRRPQTAPHPSLSPFNTRTDTHALLPILSQFPDLPTEPPKINELRPSLLSPATAFAYTPIKHTGFLNRIPKQIQIDDVSASTSSSVLSRRPSVPTLKSYIRPSTATSPNQYDQLSRSTTLRMQPSLMAIDTGKPMAEVRSRTKSSIAFSDAVFAQRRDRSLDLTPEDRTPTVSPLSFTRLRTTSEMSISPPVTASTLNDESTSSLTVYETPQEEARPEVDVGAENKLLWEMKDRTEAKIRTDADEETSAQPKPSHLSTLQNFGSTPEPGVAGSPIEPGVGSDKVVTVGRDEKTQTGTTGVKATPRRTGTIKRVWRSILGRK